jgi:serine/threonine protein kinase
MPGAAAAALQTLLGLNHMHKRKVLHRDVKTLNIFLDESFNVKIGDMGVSSRACGGVWRDALMLLQG